MLLFGRRRRRKKEKEKNREERLQLAYATLTRYFTELDGSINKLIDRAANLSAISAFLVTFASTVGLVGGDSGPRFPRWSAIALWVIIVVQTLLVVSIIRYRPIYHGPDVRSITDYKHGRWLKEKSIDVLEERLGSNGEQFKKMVRAYKWALWCLFAEVSVILAAVVESS